MNPGAKLSGCSRCGTCCRKGGPALHREDRRLVEEGVIHTRYLYTLRPGEPAEDPVAGRRVAAETDIIKIKGAGGSWTCWFFEEPGAGCRIYGDRPLECRKLECWNPAPLERAYAHGRLTRRELLGGIDGLWELVEDHERRCRIGDVLGALAAGPPKTGGRRKALAAILAYDAELRRLVVSRGGLEPEMTDFLFGRPLQKILPQLERYAEELEAARRMRP
jgi:Fe-S-cluster containining protein